MSPTTSALVGAITVSKRETADQGQIKVIKKKLALVI